MKPCQIIAHLTAVGVTLHFDSGRLRYKARPGHYTDELRKLVAIHRDELTAYLIAQDIDKRADHALAEIIRLTGGAGPENGRSRVLAVYLDLAQRWHASGDPKLFEIAPAVKAMLARWAEDDASLPREVIGGGTDAGRK